jgi:HD-like signal output (HDOD) protein
MQSLQQWVRVLGGYDLPVLRQTSAELATLRAREDSITARDVAAVTLRDPLMTLRALRFSQSRLTARQPTEVTTVEHALMMHGLASFFRQFGDLNVLEDVLADTPAALTGALQVLSRAHHAAINARNFAALRHDQDAEEVTVSALLHDLAEILLWCAAPALAMQIDRMVTDNRGLRSATAQRAVLGFTLGELQLALTREWRLPRLLQDLMNDGKADHPRVRTVRVSVALARHSAHGWNDPALPDDYATLQRLTALPPDQGARWVRVSALQAARNWTGFGVRPAAAWLPMLEGEWPAPPIASVPDRPDEGIVARVTEQLAQCARPHADVAVVVALAFYALRQAIGLRRLWFGVVDASRAKVEAQRSLFLDRGLLPGELSFDLGARQLFPKLLERTQSIWCDPQGEDKWGALLPDALRARLAARGFFAMSVSLRGAPFALVFADQGAAPGRLNDRAYAAFKGVGLALAQALDRVGA